MIVRVCRTRGSLWHAVPAEHNTSLCDKRPKLWIDAPAGQAPTCPHCLQRSQALARAREAAVTGTEVPHGAEAQRRAGLVRRGLLPAPMEITVRVGAPLSEVRAQLAAAAVRLLGDKRKAAKALGVSRRSIDNWLPRSEPQTVASNGDPMTTALIPEERPRR